MLCPFHLELASLAQFGKGIFCDHGGEQNPDKQRARGGGALPHLTGCNSPSSQRRQSEAGKGDPLIHTAPPWQVLGRAESARRPDGEGSLPGHGREVLFKKTGRVVGKRGSIAFQEREDSDPQGQLTLPHLAWPLLLWGSCQVTQLPFASVLYPNDPPQPSLAGAGGGGGGGAGIWIQCLQSFLLAHLPNLTQRMKYRQI